MTRPAAYDREAVDHDLLVQITSTLKRIEKVLARLEEKLK